MAHKRQRRLDQGTRVIPSARSPVYQYLVGVVADRIAATSAYTLKSINEPNLGTVSGLQLKWSLLIDGFGHCRPGHRVG